MRTTSRRLAAATLLATVLAASSAVSATAAPSPDPGHRYEVGTALAVNIDGMPVCSLGYGFVLLDHDQAVLVEGSGNFINEVLHRGQSVDDGMGGTLTFNRDGKSVTYNDYDQHGGKRVSEVCKPHK
ncbi:hypothetical protein [Streptomyces sp. NPDC088762]|uniref:hypothetical protein n=1 Tax=Streptomyces sp. NPDC088762 TaxID=3365891 RepID=UPI0037F4D504